MTTPSLLSQCLRRMIVVVVPGTTYERALLRSRTSGLRVQAPLLTASADTDRGEILIPPGAL